MYDGQLYRLRKEAMGNSHQQGFSDRGGRIPSRGRGGGANRGGRSGRGGSGRGGHNPGQTGRSEIPKCVQAQKVHEVTTNMFTSSVASHRSGRTPKTYSNDARRGMNNHARIDNLLAKLRAEATKADAEYQGSQKKGADALITEQRQQSAASACASKRPQAPTTMPKHSLASSDAFLAYAGFNRPPPAKPAPPNTPQLQPRLSSPSVTSKEIHEAPVGPTKARPPLAFQIALPTKLPAQQNVQRNAAEAKSTAVHDILAEENQPHTIQNGDVGLAGSRWASTGPVAERTPSTTAAPPSPVLQANTLATYGRTVLRENQVKVTQGRSKFTRGTVRLVKNNPQKDRYFTIELDVEGKSVLKQEILDDDSFSCESTVLTYKSERVEDGSAPTPRVTWGIKFQMPYQAWTFYNAVASNPNARNRHKQPDDNTAFQSGTSSAADTHNEQPMPVEESDAAPKARESVSLNAPENIRAINAVLQPGHANRLPKSAVDADTRSTAASAGSGPMSISDSSLDLRQEVLEPSYSPQRIPSSEWPLIQPMADSSSAGLLDRYQPGGSYRISSQALSEMNEIAGFGPLVSLHEPEPEPEPEPILPWIQALLNMDDTHLIQTTFDHFEESPEGPFLHQLSNMVAMDNISPAFRLTGGEILSSPKYQEASESLVGSRLCLSETFSMMPDIVTIHYTSEKARKVLKKAVAHRESRNMTEHGVASQILPDFEKPENGLSLSQYRADPVTVQALEQPNATNTAGKLKADGPRVTYSAEKLLSLRLNASSFRHENVERGVVGHVVQLPGGAKPINPANIIGPTKNGLPIVACRDQLARQSARSNVGGPSFKPTTTVRGWQAYSVAESGDLAEPLPNIRLVNGRPSSQPVAVSTQKPMVQSTPSANTFGVSTPVKTKPVASPAEPAYPSQTQETDTALWGALITTVRDRRIQGLSNTKPQTPLVSSRGSGHIPTNSECDRLAETFEVLNLSKELKEATSTPNSQPVAATDMSIGTIQSPSKDPPPPASPLTLYEEIKEALESPLTLFSRPMPRASTALSNCVANTVNSDTDSVPPTPTLAATNTAEVKTENSAAFPVSPIAQAPAIPSSTPSFPLEHSVKTESPNVNLSSVNPPVAKKREPTPLKFEVQPEDESKIDLTVIDELANLNQVRAATPMSDNANTPETVLPAPQISERALPFLQNITNKDLKGAPGLKASRWANEPVAHAPVPGARPAPMTTFIPTIPHPVYPFYANAPPQVFGNAFASPPSIHAPIVPPALQTVLIVDPMHPGHFMEVTGLPKDQVAQPVLPLMTIPPMMSPPAKQGNVQHFQQTPPANFAPRPDMYRGHKSTGSSGSDLNFNSSSTPFSPSRGHGASAISPQQRTALSPVRQGENVQTKLQSRLNSSLAGRSPNRQA